MGLLFSLWTVLVAIIFFAIVIWVLRENKDEFDKAAQIPFEESDEPQVKVSGEEDHD